MMRMILMLIGICACMLLFFSPPLGSYEGTKYNDIIYDCFKGANTADSYNKFALFNGYCPKKWL